MPRAKLGGSKQKLPLAGVRIMMTRPATASQDLAEALRAEGAIVSSVPLIRIIDPSDAASLRAAAGGADTADWLVFTSANGVAAFARARREPLPARTLIAAVGPATAASVRSLLRRPVDLLPERHDADSLASAFIAAAKPGARVAVFQPEGAASPLPGRLRAAGYAVSATAAYRTVEGPPADIARRVAGADAIVLTSGSTARSLARGLGTIAREALIDTIVVAIGESTAREARRVGMRVAIAHEATSRGLARAIAEGRTLKLGAARSRRST